MSYAFITGATSGLGKDFARLLAAFGYDLILVGRRKERLSYMESFFYNHYKTKVITFDVDLSKENDIREMLFEIDKYNIEVAINCAGYGTVSDFYLQTDEDINQMIDVNIRTVHLLTKYFANKMSYGYILNISSIASYTPGPVMAQYGATKSYVTNFTLAASYEMKKVNDKINICVACPGPIATEFDKVAGSKGNINQLSSIKCARLILNGMFKGEMLIFPGNTNKLSHYALKLLPEKLVLPIEYYIQDKKRRKA